MFLVVCLNPVLQKTIVLERLHENEVNRSREYYLDVAGKGVNTARILTQLGKSAVHLTHAGGRNRDLLLSLIRRDGVEVEAPDSGSEIRFCYTLLNRPGKTTTEIVEEGEPVSGETEGAVRAAFARLLPSAATVIIAGSKAPGYSDSLYPDFVRAAKAGGKSVILDLHGEDLRRCIELGPDLVKPNLAEFTATFVTGSMVSEFSSDEKLLAEVRARMIDINRRFGTVLVLTRGGLETLYCEDGRVSAMPVKRIEPVNTIGCGDAVTAGIAATWNSGKPVSAAVAAGMEYALLNAGNIRPGRIR
jgi:fructose-1-phosphate kinase PfkB-like protein